NGTPGQQNRPHPRRVGNHLFQESEETHGLRARLVRIVEDEQALAALKVFAHDPVRHLRFPAAEDRSQSGAAEGLQELREAGEDQESRMPGTEAVPVETACPVKTLARRRRTARPPDPRDAPNEEYPRVPRIPGQCLELLGASDE